MKLKQYLGINPPVQESQLADKDVAVWNEFRKGSELAFTALYKQYVYVLYHYGERITPNRQLIEDSIHDFFVDLWNHREGYGEISNLKFYLLKGFKYRLIKNIRKLRALPVEYDIAEDYNLEIVFSKEFEWISKQISEEKKRILLQGLNALTMREKEAITLKFYDGLTYEQIAELMSLSVKSTYKLVYRAIDALRKNLEGFGFNA
jgi:RNA polymerase sigma-70 factor (ECF subfamily)